MAKTSKKTFIVALPSGETTTVEGTNFVISENEYNVVVYDGDDEVAAFKNFQAIYPSPA